MNTLNHSVGKNYLHYNPDRIDFAVSEEELDLLQEASSNIWKDACLVLGSLGVPTIINAIHDTPEPFNYSLSLFLNYGVGIISLILAFVFGVIWYRSSGKSKALIAKIKAKPKFEFPPAAVDVGALPVE